ncbi:hypothetical protein [Pedobacter miscanthi]|uniref:Uncharacterized protein n=1 Tax=Pedobacter miscanthi TaxID=2259170 RepID=A0A366LE41_9SPHI|nr:hypothetical protein [Pedobacter miscanthi]RBQ11753.1 hypothetical protein DRW42_00290 [Pedobacter miscanthi]
MENFRHKKLRGIFAGLAAILSALFLFTPPFEKNPQQCEMVLTKIRDKKKNLRNSDKIQD